MGVPFSLMVGIIAFTSSFCTLDRDALGVCISTWMLPLWLRDSWTHFLAVCGGSFLHLDSQALPPTGDKVRGMECHSFS